MATIRVTREGDKQVDEIFWKTEELDIIEKPNGPAAAALIAAGLGALVLGIFTTWNEASQSMHDFLEIDKDVGPLSGKTTFAVIAYLIAWGVLAPLMWTRSFPWTAVLAITGVLLVGGFIGTFPEFFQEFASE